MHQPQIGHKIQLREKKEEETAATNGNDSLARLRSLISFGLHFLKFPQQDGGVACGSIRRSNIHLGGWLFVAAAADSR